MVWGEGGEVITRKRDSSGGIKTEKLWSGGVRAWKFTKKSRALAVLKRITQPIETFKESGASSCTTSLNKPLKKKTQFQIVMQENF